MDLMLELTYSWEVFVHWLMWTALPYGLTYFIHSSLLAGLVLVPIGLAVLAGFGSSVRTLAGLAHTYVVPFALGLGLITALWCGPAVRYGSMLSPTRIGVETRLQLEREFASSEKKECCCEHK